MLVRIAATALKQVPTHNFDKDFTDIFGEIRGAMFADKKYFKEADGNLLGKDGAVYIRRKEVSRDLRTLNEAAQDENSRVFAEGEVSEQDLEAMAQWEVTDAFYYFLESLPSWDFADSRFEQEMANKCRADM